MIGADTKSCWDISRPFNDGLVITCYTLSSGWGVPDPGICSSTESALLWAVAQCKINAVILCKTVMIVLSNLNYLAYLAGNINPIAELLQMVQPYETPTALFVMCCFIFFSLRSSTTLQTTWLGWMCTMMADQESVLGQSV